MVDCVREHPKNALEAWRMSLNGFKPERPYLQEWVNEGAYQGLAYGRRDKSTGEYPEHHDQAALISERWSIDRLLDNIKSEDDAKKNACVAISDKNGDPLIVKQQTTKCSKGHSCATLDENGLFVSAAKQAAKKEKQTGQGAVVPGFCVSSWNQTKSNFSNPKDKNPQLQKAEDIITRQRDRIYQLQKDKDTWSTCRPKK